MAMHPEDRILQMEHSRNEEMVRANQNALETVKPEIKARRVKLVRMEVAKIPLPLDCTEEFKQAFRRTIKKIDENLNEQKMLHHYLGAIEQQKNSHHSNIQKLQIITVQWIFIGGILDRIEEMDEIFNKMEKPAYKQRAQRNVEILKQFKNMEDGEMELKSIFEEKEKIIKERNVEKIKRADVLVNQGAQLYRRIVECEEVCKQMTEKELFEDMIEERINLDVQMLSEEERGRQLALQSIDEMDKSRRGVHPSFNARYLYAQNKKTSDQLEERGIELLFNKEQSQPDRSSHPSQDLRMNDFSELSYRKHDDIVVFKIFNDQEIEKKICRELPISDVMQFMPLLTREFIEEIKKIEKDEGNYSAVKSFLQSCAVRKLETGWSHQLLGSLENLHLENLKTSLSINEDDYNDFQERSGIPRNSLLEHISRHPAKYCHILRTPMNNITDEEGQVPVVHPEMCFFEHANQTASQKFLEHISFDDLIESKHQTLEFTNPTATTIRNNHALLLYLVGDAGCGKSTLVKRIVKSYQKHNKIAFYIPLQMVDPNRLWSLTKILLEFPFLGRDNANPSANALNRDFELVLSNQDKCLIVFDALDEIEFEITDPPADVDINGEMRLNELLSLVFSRRLLPKARIIIASRPRPYEIRSSHVISMHPDFIVALGNLPQTGLETLIKHYIPSEDSKNLLKTIQTKSPRVYELIHTPLFLHFFVMVYRESGERIWSVNTTTKLFSETLKVYEDSAHFARQNMIKDLDEKLGKIAFKQTMQAKYLTFKESDLEGLRADDIQDFIFSFVPESSDQGNLSSVKLFMFNHFSVQEFLTAQFAKRKLDLDQFDDFLGKIFPPVQRLVNSEDEELERRVGFDWIQGRLEIDKDIFANIRHHMIGLMNDVEDYEDLFSRKRKMFIERLCTHLRQIFVTKISAQVEDYQFATMKNMMDFTNDNIVAEIREQLKTFDFWFGDFYFNQSLHLKHEFLYFVGKFVTNVKCFRETTDIIKNSTMRSFTGKVEELRLSVFGKLLQLDSLTSVGDIVALFPKITHNLIIDLIGCKIAFVNAQPKDYWEAQRDFWIKLNEEIQQFDTNMLQNEKLELKFRSGGRLFLSCSLSRGEKPPKLSGYILSLNHNKATKIQID